MSEAITVSKNPTAALKRPPHPNTLRALEENRHRTQFGGPDAPATCARETCGRAAWGKSPSGFCWYHAGNVKAKRDPRSSENGKKKRELNRSRKMACKNLDHEPPTPEELRFAANLVPKLSDPHDRPRLEMMVRDVFRGRIDHRTYRAHVELLLNRP
ncbi:hypothetical protein [Ruegeria conchae]|uniref:hypothetical protein n=1 Tax=Ruegeria conchae TaxID=981384 RepID=UPI0029C7B883|nr:hypothetical protein [Ruegeria conchae]